MTYDRLSLKSMWQKPRFRVNADTVLLCGAIEKNGAAMHMAMLRNQSPTKVGRRREGSMAFSLDKWGPAGAIVTSWNTLSMVMHTDKARAMR